MGLPQATVDAVVDGGEGFGMVLGTVCGQAEQSLCKNLGVINAPQTLGKMAQPGKLDIVGAGAASLAALAVPLSSSRGLIPQFPHL